MALNVNGPRTISRVSTITPRPDALTTAQPAWGLSRGTVVVVLVIDNVMIADVLVVLVVLREKTRAAAAPPISNAATAPRATLSSGVDSTLPLGTDA
jgi:hypothetical protein